MVRYIASDPGKNQGRGEIIKLWPKCMSSERPSKGGKPNLVFIDFLAKLKNQKPTIIRKKNVNGPSSAVKVEGEKTVESRRLFGDVVTSISYLIGDIYSASKTDDHPLWLVLGCDKHEFVSDARGIVHDHRNEKKKAPARTSPPAEIKLDLEEPIPEDWSEYFDDRERWRGEIMRFLILSTIKMISGMIDGNVLIIFDGHMFDKESIFNCGWPNLLKNCGILDKGSKVIDEFT